MSTCRACGAECRTTTIALVLEHQRIKSGRVCQKCAKGGTLIVPKIVFSPTILAPKPSKKTARELLRPIIKTLEAQVAAVKATRLPDGAGRPEQAFLDGKVEAGENVIATLKAVEA